MGGYELRIDQLDNQENAKVEENDE